MPAFYYLRRDCTKSSFFAKQSLMRKLPRQYVLLRRINNCITELFSTQGRVQTLRLVDVYDYLIHKDEFRCEFPTPESFSRFMRRMYDEGVLKQFIRNCEVDTSVWHHYQWYFYPPVRTVSRSTTAADKNEALTVTSDDEIMRWGKRLEASNGVMVRSTQELHIINRLLREKSLAVFYERPLRLGGQVRYPDFTIYSTVADRIFYWEHFGMTGRVSYADEMVEKIRWYKRFGYSELKEGGSLVVTIYHDDSQFVALTEHAVSAILSAKRLPR